MRHLWLDCMVLLCVSAQSASAEFAFPDRDAMAAVMGQVTVPNEEFAASSFQTSTPSSLRGSSSGSAPADQDDRDAISLLTGSQDSSILPGRNGFGHVSYDANTPASASSSNSAAAAAAAAAADARARIRHADKVASATSPDNLLKLRATF